MIGLVAAGSAVLTAGGFLVADAVAGNADKEPQTGPTVVTGPTVSPTPVASLPAGSVVTTEPVHVVGGCESPTVEVDTAEELVAALDAAKPGWAIEVAAGTYTGEFVTTRSGTADSRIVLCGTPEAVLDGDGMKSGYGFHLDGAEYWHLQGFTVTNAQKGVMADGTTGTVIEGLTVHGIGDEAIHLRNFSTDNTVTGNVIYDTGNRREKFGEGIYIGTANSNWCDISGCEPDRSDGNLVENNTIYDVTAEAVDIKEGTTGGILRGNRFDGSGVTEDGADSWVDVKGNEWLIEANSGENSPLDGFQVHDVSDGWGRGNIFRDNVAAVNGPGFGFSLTPPQDNVVECSNTVSGAGEGYSNEPCR